MKTIKLDRDLEGSQNNGYGGLTSVTPGVKDFPTFSFTESTPCDIPDEGELTIKFRLVKHAEDTTNEDRPKYSYTVCVKKLISAVAHSDKSPTRKYDEAGDALDALAKAKNNNSNEEESY
jgi:hypothetical protein